MTPSGHLLAGGAIGAVVYGTTGSWPGALAALAAGVLPDLDHALDYYNWLFRHRLHRVFYLFHGWEHLGLLVLASALLGWTPVMLGLTLGYASHVAGDYLVSHRHVLWYSILFRAKRRFHRGDLRRTRRKFPPAHRHNVMPPPDQRISIGELLRWLLLRSFPLLRKFLASDDVSR
ncbi:MAG: hypothetical protein ACE5Q6_08160 [Dehalococcoidia bacterium]